MSVVMPGMTQAGMNPIGTVPASTVAANAVDAIRRDRSYVFMDDSTDEDEQRLTAILAARHDVLAP